MSLLVCDVQPPSCSFAPCCQGNGSSRDSCLCVYMCVCKFVSSYVYVSKCMCLCVTFCVYVNCVSRCVCEYVRFCVYVS